MKYTYGIQKKQDVIIKIYVARIIGEDPTYFFKRKFLRWKYNRHNNEIWFTFDIGRHGVFEQSVKQINTKTGDLIHIERKWFVYFRKKFYEIYRDEVMFCVYNLKLQYSKNKREE